LNQGHDLVRYPSFGVIFEENPPAYSFNPVKNPGHILIVTLFLLSGFGVFAQSRECSMVWNDTLRLCPGTRVMVGSRVFLVSTDTLIAGREIESVYILHDPYGQTRQMYDTLKQKASRSDFTRLAFQLMFPESGEVTESGISVPEVEGSQVFEEFRGRIIRNIIIRRSKPFIGARDEPDAWLGSLGNSLHRTTHENVVRNHLIIREDDTLSPFRLAENAQILRSLPYFSEVKIRPVAVQGRQDQADVVIWVRDVFPIGIEMAFGTLRLADLTLFDRNFLGRGHLLSGTTRITTAYKPVVTVQNLHYRIPNIMGTFVFAEADYGNVLNHESLSLGLGRDFYESGTRLAGGLAFSHHNQTVNIFSPVFRQDDVRYNHQELWLGRAFSLKRTDRPLNLVLAASLRNKLYTFRPYVAGDTNQLYYNSSHVLFSFSLSQNAYYQGNYIYQFGRTEDVPYGFLAEFTIGPEGYEYYSRAYVGFRLGFARYLPKLGYFNLQSDFSAYNRKGVFEQGQVGINTGYFSNLSVFGFYKLRHFVNLHYRTGFKRLSGESVNVVSDLELMLDNPDDTLHFAGTKKLVMKYAAWVYTPYYYMGFRFAFSNFVNLAFVGSAGNLAFNNRFFSGFGLGCMLRNENLVIKTIQLRLGFYPELPDGRTGIFFEFSGIAPLGFFDYKPRKPAVHPYE